MARPLLASAAAALLLLGPASAATAAAAGGDGDHRESQLVPAVVVVTTFSGEFVRWRERLPLGRDLPFPAGGAGRTEGPALGWNGDLRVLALVTGMGPRSAALSVTALGHDPRFDLRRARWLLAGIAGIDPQRATLGSAAWARHLVDGDAARFIDPREAPRDWPTGWMPLVRREPYGMPPPSAVEREGMVYELSPELTAWAFSQTRSLLLPDRPERRRACEPYAAVYPAVSGRPSVLLGDVLATNAWWSGELSAAWARNWTQYWTSGAAAFATSAMEDTAVAGALAALARAGRARAPTSALLVLRAGSNFVLPPPGGEPAVYPMAFQEELAYEAAYIVGSAVVHALARGEGPRAGGGGAERKGEDHGSLASTEDEVAVAIWS